MASVQVLICSPAAAPTMVAPRMQPLRIGHHLDVAARLALRLGAVVVVIGPAQQPDVAVLLACLALGEPDMGQFRVGEGDARDLVDVHARPAAGTAGAGSGGAAW